MKTMERQSIHVPHAVIVRAAGLLPMRYTLRELATDLGCSPNLLQGWIRRGMPHARDQHGHIWIVGTEFANWIDQERRRAPSVRLLANQAYCLRCNRPVDLVNPIVCSRGKHIRLRSQCPTCGATVYRAVKYGESPELPSGA